MGVPYGIFRVLPIVFADKLPSRPGTGWEKIGFLNEAPDRDHPIGTTHARGQLGVDLVGLNCATCHSGTYRETPTSPKQVVLGMPAHQMDLQAYSRFLTACAQDPRFTAATIIDAIRKLNPDFGFIDSLTYRLVVVGRTRSGILDRAKETSWFDARPPQGPGRVDTFNPYKAMFRLRYVRRRYRGHRRPAFIVEPAPAPQPVAALGRQQQPGRRTKQERGDRCRCHARNPSTCAAARRASRNWMHGFEGAGVSSGRESIRRAPRAARTVYAEQPAPPVMTSAAPQVGQVTPTRADRHRSRAPPLASRRRSRCG